ncbi:alpha/beta fold hydrolase [Variovorax sp. MHTC-1]|uniref:alpha/beta fold hydrolase n=1 Tax=Variovorax sp. MHTC-1 TaxID=2495593 RepID=UPI000F85C825|nr:alpha/beta fold hydrolase [Variovorax sp. MHTC-1]RST49440.1 alpha/beta fold hydrolase [Variovorax sp. MHTC-1]
MSIELACEAVGDGPPVVILHGLFGAGRNWARIARALGDSHRVYLPDARNHGASPRGQTMSYTEMAQDVLALIERERLQRPLLIGHSMGGKTAMTLALEHPQAISGLAVVDIAPERYSDQFSPYMMAMRGFDAAAATGRNEARQALAQDQAGDTPVLDFLMQNLRRHDERFDWRLNLLAVAMCMQELCGFPRRFRHRQYEGPALFLAGTESSYVQAESHDRIARLFPRAHLEHIDDAGHWVHADQPGALLRALRRWLHRHEAGTPRTAAPQAALAVR